MNVLLWVLQVLLALHTTMGAIWKFSHSPAQTMPSLKAIPQPVWFSISILELLCALCLILPAVNTSLGILAPSAAIFIAAIMFLWCGVHLNSGTSNFGPMIYWLVVAAFCALIAYGRFVLKPF